MDFKALEFRQNLKILIMFLIVQFFGLFMAAAVYSGAQETQLNSAQVGASINYALSYIVGILLFTLVLLFIIKKARSDKVFIILEAFAVGGASFIAFLVLIGVATNTVQSTIYGNSVTYEDAAALILAASLILAKNKWPRLRNTVSILSSAGLGFFIGINLTFPAVYVFMVLLAVYDFIAVFVTKHMVVMGERMSGMNLAFLVGASEAEAVPRRKLSREELEKAAKHRQIFEKQGNLLKDLDRQHLVPVYARRELGNGDLAVPLMAAVSAYQMTFSFMTSFVVIFGATFGLLLTFYVLNRYKRALPAIPPLLFGITVALLVYVLLGGSNLL